ncbi:MAG: hypothetical protein K2Z80_35295 [Xanthobacteraceae bacterium]|nr:hypothetical protein [Xanthobacteraceae bacterium]
MRDLERALTDIRAMRSQIARGTEFRGYGPAAFAATGVLAIFAALAQAHFIENPSAETTTYLALWIAIALIAAVIVGADVVTRSRRVHSGLADEMIQSAAEQLLPAGIAGALLTIVIARTAPQSLWMLPGLWQIMLSVGVFAACRILPAPLFIVGVWYLGTGLACLAFGSGEHAFSPWAMGLPFGIGQLLAAALIYVIGLRDAED